MASTAGMTTLLEQARAACVRRDWPRAHELYSAARAQGELPADDLYALSDAAWWLGDADVPLEACEAAYWSYLESDRPRRAAIAALDIAAVLYLRGEEGPASGWLSRASRHLEAQPEAAEHGYLIYFSEVEGPLGGVAPTEPVALEILLASACRVREIGRRFGDRTLMAAGMLGEGRAWVRAGRVAQGMALLDEVLLAARSGELIPAWAGNLYCHLIEAAEEVRDFRRARDWAEALTHWLATMPAAVVYNGICRVHRSRLQQLSGAWDEAEREAERVCTELGRLHVAATAKAHYQVGEIRRLRGDFSGAEAAYGKAHALGRDPQPGLALLRLAQGRTGVAAASIRTALLAEGNRLARAGLRAAQVEIALAAGSPDQAREAASELDEIAGLYASSGLKVAARHARGAILLAEGRPLEALPVLRGACMAWSDVGVPYDCARIRLLLGHVYRLLGDEDAAARELDLAVAVFERLGAVCDLRSAHRLAAEARRPAGLTPRECEVLALVASGRTNKAIARALELSDRTVARHLSNIFAKLGVTTRTAAAAIAHQYGLAHAATTPLEPPAP
jgi:DNA-binding CsgD family transcriptional regulator